MDIKQNISTFLIMGTIIIYFMLFTHIIYFLVLEPIFAMVILIYIITITSININFYNSIGIMDDSNKESERIISKNVNITILSFAVLTLITSLLIDSGMTYVLYFTPVGKIINTAKKASEIIL